MFKRFKDMDAKLITDGNNNYSVLDYNNELVATNMESGFTNQKLSIKNCEAIKNGYDLDELINNLDTPEGYDQYQYDSGVRKGFELALELLGDKKFSDGEMKKSFEYGATATLMNSQGRYNLEKAVEISFEESLQPKEWDVEIEMENYEISDDHGNSISCERPKLDADGCLILKRKS